MLSHWLRTAWEEVGSVPMLSWVPANTWKDCMPLSLMAALPRGCHRTKLIQGPGDPKGGDDVELGSEGYTGLISKGERGNGKKSPDRGHSMCKGPLSAWHTGGKGTVLREENDGKDVS